MDADGSLLLSSEGLHAEVLRVSLRRRRAPQRRFAVRADDRLARSARATESREDSELPETTETQRPAWPWFLGGPDRSRAVLVVLPVAASPLASTGGFEPARAGYCPAMPRLRRTSPDQPGWTRRRAGKGFVYLDERGRGCPRRTRSGSATW